MLEDYRVTLSAVECTAATLRYTLEYAFDNEARMNAFIEARRSMGLWPIAEGEDTWFGLAETNDPESPAQMDGIWVLRYDCHITDIWRMPEEIDIIPFNVRTDLPYHPDERFHVCIPKP